MRTGNHSTEAKPKSSKSKNGRDLTNGRFGNGHKKILPEHEVFVYQSVASGKSYQETADAVKEKFKVSITKQGIGEFLQRNSEAYLIYLAKLKDVRLANAKARLLDMQGVANQLKEKLHEITGYAPILWQELKLSSLINSYVNLMEQIAVDSGDRRQGDRRSDAPSQTLIFNDVTINEFADKAIHEARKNPIVARDRFDPAGFLDSTDSISSN